MPRATAFGPYHTTDRTLWRPTVRTFAPAFKLDTAILDDLRHLERADERLRSVLLDRVEARRLIEEALTRNAFGTASIEGNPLTLEEVTSLLQRGPTPEALRRPEEREILNYAAYMERIDREPLPDDLDGLRRLHATLFDGVLPDAGAFKRARNFVGQRPSMEVAYVPAPPGRVRPELTNALDWFHAAPEHPVVRVAVFFHEFQGIHPFRDGNGRAGRALATHQLLATGYPGVRSALVDYEFNADREGYYSSLSAVEANGYDFTPWIRYMVRILRRTFEGALERASFRRTLPAALNDRQVRLALWFARVARDAPERRLKLADVHAVHPTIPERTLRRDLRGLARHGVLESQGQLKGTTYRLPPERLR